LYAIFDLIPIIRSRVAVLERIALDSAPWIRGSIPPSLLFSPLQYRAKPINSASNALIVGWISHATCVWNARRYSRYCQKLDGPFRQRVTLRSPSHRFRQCATSSSRISTCSR